MFLVSSAVKCGVARSGSSMQVGSQVDYSSELKDSKKMETVGRSSKRLRESSVTWNQSVREKDLNQSRNKSFHSILVAKPP